MKVTEKYVVFDLSPGEKRNNLPPVSSATFKTRKDAREFARKSRKACFEAKIFKLMEVR